MKAAGVCERRSPETLGYEDEGLPLFKRLRGPLGVFSEGNKEEEENLKAAGVWVFCRSKKKRRSGRRRFGRGRRKLRGSGPRRRPRRAARRTRFHQPSQPDQTDEFLEPRCFDRRVRPAPLPGKSEFLKLTIWSWTGGQGQFQPRPSLCLR